MKLSKDIALIKINHYLQKKKKSFVICFFENVFEKAIVFFRSIMKKKRKPFSKSENIIVFEVGHSKTEVPRY